MKQIILIRHAQTHGNLEKRYIGTTDEPVTPEGVKLLQQHSYPQADAVYTSPMLRCVQSAQIVYPNLNPIVVPDLKECNFGIFEGKNYLELSDSTAYQAWIDSNGKLPFPDGESRTEFSKRCINAFQVAINQANPAWKSIAFVIHGGTIMAILEHFSQNPDSFYQWQIENGNGYVVNYQNGTLDVISKLW